MHLARAIQVVRGTWTTDAFWHSEKRCCSWREMERWKFDVFFSPRCAYVWELFLLAILSCKDFWSYQAEWPLVSNLSRFASIFQIKTSDFNKTLFICLHLCHRCTESSLALIPGIANLVGDFKMTPKLVMVVETVLPFGFEANCQIFMEVSWKTVTRDTAKHTLTGNNHEKSEKSTQYHRL